MISDFLFQIRKGNLNCGIVHGPSCFPVVHLKERSVLQSCKSFHGKTVSRSFTSFMSHNFKRVFVIE